MPSEHLILVVNTEYYYQPPVQDHFAQTLHDILLIRHRKIVALGEAIRMEDAAYQKDLEYLLNSYKTLLKLLPKEALQADHCAGRALNKFEDKKTGDKVYFFAITTTNQAVIAKAKIFHQKVLEMMSPSTSAAVHDIPLPPQALINIHKAILAEVEQTPTQTPPEGSTPPFSILTVLQSCSPFNLRNTAADSIIAGFENLKVAGPG